MSELSKQPTQFGAVAPHYDLLMQGVPYAAWILYLRQILSVWKVTPRTVLDLACGTGNVTELLQEEGYDVVGVDIAEDMIAQARNKAEEKGLTIPYYIQDAAELNVEKRRFDLCVSLFDSMNYILEPKRLQVAFERVYAHLNKEGLFIFDLNTDFALQNQFFDQDNINSTEPLKYDWRSTYYPKSNRCKIDMQFAYAQEDGEIVQFKEVHWQYAYSVQQIVEMLTAAGFSLYETYQAYTLRSPSATADRIFYVAKKRA